MGHSNIKMQLVIWSLAACLLIAAFAGAEHQTQNDQMQLIKYQVSGWLSRG